MDRETFAVNESLDTSLVKPGDVVLAHGSAVLVEEVDLRVAAWDEVHMDGLVLVHVPVDEPLHLRETIQSSAGTRLEAGTDDRCRRSGDRDSREEKE